MRKAVKIKTLIQFVNEGKMNENSKMALLRELKETYLRPPGPVKYLISLLEKK